MGRVPKPTEVVNEVEVDDARFYPDDEEARAKAESIYNEAYMIVVNGQAKSKGAIRFRIKDSSIIDEVKSRILECIYMYITFGRAIYHLEDEAGAQSARIALAEAHKILASLDAIPKMTRERFLKQVPKRGSIFGKSWHRSVREFADHCSRTIAGSQKSKGRPANDKLDVITEEVVQIFEFWVGRRFKKTTALAKGKFGEESSFVGPDAACVHSILKGIDPSITVSQIRTALNKRLPTVQK